MMFKPSFYWKFSRDGDYSKTYSAFIIDVPDTYIVHKNNRLIWRTSFNCIAKVLLLLQDIEIFNKKNGERNAGLTKTPYIKAVMTCGYKPPENFSEKRKDMVCGRAVMGKHSGSPLDWGFYIDESTNEKIDIDVTEFQPALHVSASTGISNQNTNRDLLSCYRSHSKFVNQGFFWDLMPRHIHMVLLFEALTKNNSTHAIDFVKNELGWAKI